MLIPKLKDPDPNPSVTISVLAAIGEQAQVIIIEDIKILGMKMPFISSSEVKNAYFISGKATNEIYIFSLHEMNKWHIHSKNLNFLFIIYNVKRDRFFSRNDVIHVHT